jgi:hypothetical protein
LVRSGARPRCKASTRARTSRTHAKSATTQLGSRLGRRVLTAGRQLSRVADVDLVEELALEDPTRHRRAPLVDPCLDPRDLRLRGIDAGLRIRVHQLSHIEREPGAVVLIGEHPMPWPVAST